MATLPADLRPYRPDSVDRSGWWRSRRRLWFRPETTLRQTQRRWRLVTNRPTNGTDLHPDLALTSDDSGLICAYTSPDTPEAIAGQVAQIGGLTLRRVTAYPAKVLPRLSSGKIDYEQLRRHLPG